MPTSQLNVIKIGGSVITHKHERDSFNKEATVAVARHIPPGTLLVHGTGSFGKPPAIQFGYLHGIIRNDGQRAILHVRQKLATLNGMFVNTLLEHHGAALGISATTIFSDVGRISFSGRRLIDRCLDRNITPVIFSDLIFFGEDSLRVLSSDQIVSILSTIYHPQRVVFATDVDGVHTTSGPPGIYDYLTPADLQNKVFISRSRSDVSGGMHDKLEFAVRAANSCSDCIILNGLHPERISRFCEGDQQVIGTRVVEKIPKSALAAQGRSSSGARQ